MAKASVQPEKIKVYPYPNRFGTSSENFIKDLKDGIILCKDEFGEYKTEKSKLNNGMADPNRWSLASREQNYRINNEN